MAFCESDNESLNGKDTRTHVKQFADMTDHRHAIFFK